MRILKHLAFLLIVLLPGLVFWQWASQPMWQLTNLTRAKYHCHDAERQEVIVFVTRGNEHTLETYQYRTGELLKQVPFKPIDGSDRLYAYPNTKPRTNDNDLVVMAHYVNNARNVRYSIAKRNGSELKVEPPAPATTRVDPTTYGERVALPTSHGVMLYKTNDCKPRTIEMRQVIAIRILPPGNLIACLAENTLHLVEWSTGKIVASRKMKAPSDDNMSMSCTKQGDILVCSGPNSLHTLERLRWNGRELVSVGTVAQLPNPFTFVGGIRGLHIAEDHMDRMHVAKHIMEGLPKPWRDWHPWLNNKLGLSLEKYIDRQRIFGWHILDQENRVLGHYESLSIDMQFLDKYLCFQAPSDMKTGLHVMQVVRTHPAWPNALAISVVLYLLLNLVRHRHRQT